MTRHDEVTTAHEHAAAARVATTLMTATIDGAAPGAGPAPIRLAPAGCCGRTGPGRAVHSTSGACASSPSSPVRSAPWCWSRSRALWWRLSSGPIELDLATPWLSAAIKENFGSGHDVEIGGTQIERDAAGRTSLRIRDIVVRDADGTVVASAPKAEVGISGWGLLTGRIRAERLSLVGAEMAVRIESDSNVTVFAGSNKRPFVTASATATPAVTTGAVPMGALPTGNLERPRMSALAPVPMPAPAPAARGDMPDFASHARLDRAA